MPNISKNSSLVSRKSAFLGAAFLMATSAIGPGFLTQTTVFTQKLGAAFGFAIVVSILLDIGAQLNIWRIVAVSERRGQDLANALRPGLGHLLAALIVVGGLAFNIGNLAGCGLGLQALFGLPVAWGAAISAVISLFIFFQKELGAALDGFAKWLGVIMLALTIFIAWKSQPPLFQAVTESFWPSKFDAKAVLTLVGGTVGGYISFAGAHRLLDAGLGGSAHLPQVMRASMSGILLTGLMRMLLFLAALGVVSSGFLLDEKNPAGSVFEAAAGDLGLRFFGLVMWIAAITSVVGSAFTSVSFLKTLAPVFEKNQRGLLAGFVLFSLAIFLVFGKPVQILVAAGLINGLILPVGLAVVLLAATKKRVVGENYRHPFWMFLAGWLVVALMAWLSAAAFWV